MSSPWPDHIDIVSVTSADSTWVVHGTLIETTSTGDDGHYPLALRVARLNRHWRITDFSIEARHLGHPCDRYEE